MIETNSLSRKDAGKTKVISRVINLGTDLDLFISGASKDSSFLDYLINKILDNSIDRISENNTYNDFSNTLEHINQVLKTWNIESDSNKMHMIIGVLHKNEFIFSNIGNSSCYLIKKSNAIEITDQKDRKKEFSYISSGELENGDIVTLSTKRLLNYLSESDFIDSYRENLNKFNESIDSILEEEGFSKNISVISLLYKTEEEVEKKQYLVFAKNIFYKILDNNFIKRIIAIFLILKARLLNKTKAVKNIFFVIGILFFIFLLYILIGKTVDTNTQSVDLESNKVLLEEAQVSLRKASESMSNPDIFELNITHTEGIIKQIEEKKIFLKDIELIKEKVARIKKSFNGIESFEEESDKALFNSGTQTFKKIVGVNKKIYLVGENSVSGPVIAGSKPRVSTFSELGDDSFIDATNIGNNISLITSKGKIVTFSQDGNFRFNDVIGQDKWEDSNIIESYASNIYLISQKDKQIYKHTKSGNRFGKGTPYLKSSDQKTLEAMRDIAIDGGFYILKKDLSFVKFFSTPYRLESLSLNKLPSNYKVEKPNSPIKIKTRPELNYVYMLLNNKIFVFKPNSGRFQDTKSLTYVGQVEGRKYDILDFYVKFDGEIKILNKAGVFTMNFEVSDGKLLLR